jgi:hypothetical protein
MKIDFHKSGDAQYVFKFWDLIRHRDGREIRQIRWKKYILSFIFTKKKSEIIMDDSVDDSSIARRIKEINNNLNEKQH